jgi:diguanylate cyclase (GGDEF)-like protein
MNNIMPFPVLIMNRRHGRSFPKARVFVIITILFIFVIPLTTGALNPAKEFFQFHLSNWKMDGDLIDNIVYCSLQDSSGYIWLGTTKGLVRFDGIRFKTFDNNNVPEQLTKYLVRVLYEARDKTIWIGTDGGLIKLGNGRITAYTTNEGLPHNIITALCSDSRGNLWIGTDGGGLTSFRDGRFFTYTTNEGLSSNFLKCIKEDKEGNLWVGTRKGLNRFSNGNIAPSSNPADIRIESSVLSIVDDSVGNLWIGTNEGLKKISGRKLTSFSNADGITETIVLNLYIDRTGILWIGTGAGLYRMKNGEFSKLTVEDGLFGNAVNSILEDREGSMWIGTVDGGLNRLKDVSFTSYTSRQGLADDMVRCVIEDRDGCMWIGTSGGLSRLREGEWISINPAPSAAGNYIASVLEDRGGMLWLGTRDGLYRGNRETGIFSLFAPQQRFSGYVITSLHEDSAGTLWVGTLGSGLHFYKNKQWYKYTTENGLSNNYIKCLHEDARGNIWIGTQEGLNRLIPGTDTFTVYSVSHGLAHDAIICIYEDKDGAFWIGTRNGPTRFEDGIFFPYFNQVEEFLNNGLFAILEDSRGYLWMSSNKGVFRVWKKELNDLAAGESVEPDVRFFNEADGLRSRVCNGGTQPAGWKSRDGRLWFPTICGAAVVEPGKLIRNRQPPPVLVEEIVIDDKEYAGTSGVTRGSAVFCPGVKNLEFHYTALSYLQPEMIRFKYRLLGYDAGWVNAGTRRTAYYTNLSPGNYTFRVIACNNDGLWNSDGASYEIYLEPYFYQTTWFLVLCCVVIIIGAGVLYRWRVSALTRHRKELELLVDDRTRQLKIANRKLSETNQELKKLASLDGLTGIYNFRWFGEFLEIEWKRAARMRKYVTIILIDVDFFKLYNDTYGHQEGDECLRQIARKLKEECRRPGDVVARYGGEEFIVLLLDAPSDIAAAMAERLWNGIRQLRIPHLSSRVSKYVTISLGCATTIPTGKDAPSWLIKSADTALYESKQAGRNRVTIKVEV